VKEILMEFTKAILKIVKEKAMELFNGIMDKNFKEIGKKASNVVLVYGDLQKEIAIKENG
jgi:hypothetical protein